MRSHVLVSKWERMQQSLEFIISHQKIMLNYYDRRRDGQLHQTSIGPFISHNCENKPESSIKLPMKQLYLLAPQNGGTFGAQNSPRSARTTYNTTSNLNRSYHDPSHNTPNKQIINNQSFFTQKSNLLINQKKIPSTPSETYSKQNSYRTFKNDPQSQKKANMLQDVSNTRLRSNLQLRQTVSSTNNFSTNTLPPRSSKTPLELFPNVSKEKQSGNQNASKSKDKLKLSKYAPKHTRTRTTTQEDHMDRQNLQFKQQQSQTNTPKTSTPRTNTPSMEKIIVSTNVTLNPTQTPNAHTSNTVSNFQKFLAKRLSSTLTHKSQFRTPHLQDFDIGPCKGEGRFGKVYPARHKKSGFLVAIKKIKKELVRDMLKQFIGQLKIGLYLNHANVVKTYGIFHDSVFIYVLMEYMEEGSLYRMVRIGNMDEDQVAPKLLEVCQAVRYLHSLNILHRDIKPQNIVLSNGICKLCDFGWAVCSRQRRKTYCGTLDYVCPQILQGETYDKQVDVWSIGVLAFEMLTGKAPFYHASRQETMKSIIKCDFVFPLGMSLAAKTFIAKTLQKQADKRITIEQLIKDEFLYQDDDEQ